MKKDKTNRIRINENAIRKIVESSLKQMLSEAHRPKGVSSKGKRIFRDGETFYPVASSKKYSKAQGLDQSEYYKVGTVKARPSVAGKQNAGTKLAGGFAERDGYVEKGNTMIVRNPKG